MLAVDTEAATKRLMRFLAVEGVTGQEAAIGKELVATLKEAGVPATASVPLSNFSVPNRVRTSSVRLEPIRPVMQRISPAYRSKLMSRYMPCLVRFSTLRRISPVPRG